MTLWVALLLLVATAAAIAPMRAACAGVTAAPGATSDPTSLAQVTVEGHLLAQKTLRFVMDVTAASGFFMDSAVQQSRRPICPLVGGLPSSTGHLVFDRWAIRPASCGCSLLRPDPALRA